MVWITRTLSLIILSEAFAFVILGLYWTILVLRKEIENERKSSKQSQETERSKIQE